MKSTIRLLHLEDDSRDAEVIREKLKAEGLSCDITWVNGREAFESALEGKTFDLVLSDFNLPGYDGLSALQHVREKQPELPVIIISGTIGEEAAVKCLQAGATDYVLKQRLQRLGASVTRAAQEAEQRQRVREADVAMRESEERYRRVVELMPSPLILRRGEQIFCERGCAEVFRCANRRTAFGAVLFRSHSSRSAGRGADPHAQH